jgi:hypothetical protein
VGADEKNTGGGEQVFHALSVSGSAKGAGGVPLRFLIELVRSIRAAWMGCGWTRADPKCDLRVGPLTILGFHHAYKRRLECGHRHGWRAVNASKPLIFHTSTAKGDP